ncbi:MAG: OadG family protein [Bacilli bacterium]
MNLLKILVDKTSQMNPGEGALYSIVSILMVFLILLIIIGVTSLVFKVNGLFDLKKELEAKKNGAVEETKPAPVPSSNKEVVINDDDMMAAVLVATIDYRNEIKKDVRVVNVREIK